MYPEVIWPHCTSYSTADNWSPHQTLLVSCCICTPLPPRNTCTLHGTSGNVGTHQGGIKGSAFSRSSQYFSAYRSSFWGIFPTHCKSLTQSKGYSQSSPDLIPHLMHPSPSPTRQETGHTSYICPLISVSPPTPPLAESLLTGPGVKYPGFLG
jgi:hypothetical protein